MTAKNYLVKIRLLLLIILACIMAACGGGGDEDLAEDQDDPLRPSYSVPLEAEETLNFLNAERQHCGFGEFNSDSLLALAASGHADYQIINNLLTHDQDFDKYPNGFTGERPIDRVMSAGYSDAAMVTDEVVRFTGVTDRPGISGVRYLLSAPYHLRGLMGPYRDAGIAVHYPSSASGNKFYVYVQMNMAYRYEDGPQQIEPSEVLTYPCDGIVGVNRQLRNESPNPVPGRDLLKNPLGTAIFVTARDGNTLTIDRASVTEVGTGLVVKLRLPVTSVTDPYAGCYEGCFEPHQGYIIPDQPLKAMSSYKVLIEGLNNGLPFTKTFSFTTGDGG